DKRASRIAGITLDEHTVVRRNPDIEHERAVAIFDLLEENHFAPCSGCNGPYHLHLAIEENRLSIEIRSMANGSNETITLPLAPFRGIVKDYFMVCDSYYEAIRRSSLAQKKAQAVVSRHPGAYVLAADTVVVCGRRIMPKTEDEASARSCLKQLSGRRHRVHGAIALVSPDGRLVSRRVESQVSFKRLSE